jgi:hypothetical protein
MKKILYLLLVSAISLPATANEGMWLPMLLGRNMEDMKAHGLQLSAEDIYSINNGSLKDAIVSFGGFCTGEIISDQGLILTNHHCGFGAIQTHSTPENDYLSDGFWAMSLEEEIPNEDLFVRFLVRMEDVTNRVLDELNDEMSEAERAAAIAAIAKEISGEATQENEYEANVKSFYHGNEFYLFVYEKYDDVRLVGAPPSSIGKFGGDTDNWMWPRHTGDFSLFRVYADADNNPAAYAESNVPLKPKHHLPVSVNGVKDGDFTMVMGYPGSTDRYLSSHGVEQAITLYNPTVVKIRDEKLAIMKKYMDQSDATRIQYASKYAQTANYWKYYIGQTEQLKGNKVYDKKKAIEDKFALWVSKDPARKAKYGAALDLLKEGYADKDSYVASTVYVREAGLLGADLPLFAYRMNRLLGAYVDAAEKMEEEMDEAETDSAEAAISEKYSGRMNQIKTATLNYASEFYQDYNATLDEEMMATLFKMYSQEVPENQQPEFLVAMADDYKGDWAEYAEEVFEETILLDSNSLVEFLEDPDGDDLEEDLAIIAGNSLIKLYRGNASSHKETEEKLDKGYRLLTAGLREMNPAINYSPDANSTMRITYGTVGSYEPRDGVKYDYFTTAEGILQKMDNDDPEFVVPERLEKLIRQGSYGRYANEEGELPICFIHNTDITGGNSGSPVINGKGELIGTAFDGNWEAMSGDIFFEEDLQRTISVDARYILFVIEQYAMAYNLIKEIDIVDNDPPMTDKQKAAQKGVEKPAAEAAN